MDDAMKKPIMIGVIVVCLCVAAYITFSGGGTQEIEEIEEDATVWMKCANIKCARGTTVFEANKLEYVDFQRANLAEDTTPGFTCQVCGKPSAFKAIECPSCQNVFLQGESGPDEIYDKCPKCQYSKREDAG